MTKPSEQSMTWGDVMRYTLAQLKMAHAAGFIAGQDAAARLVETKYRAVYDHATDTDCDDIADAIRSLKPPPREFPS